MSQGNVGRRALGFVTYYGTFFYFLVLAPGIPPRETESRFRCRLRTAIRISFAAFGIKLVVRGTENLRRDGNAIIVANHSSWFDQLALLAALDLPVTFMANRKYFGYPGLARVLRKLQCIPTPSRSVAECLRAGRDRLENGKWLVVYPEGTRSSTLLPFRRGAGVIAGRTGIPIQPIVIRGAREILPRRRSLWHTSPGCIELHIHPLFATDGSSPREVMARIRRIYDPGVPPDDSGRIVSSAETPPPRFSGTLIADSSDRMNRERNEPTTPASLPCVKQINL